MTDPHENDPHEDPERHLGERVPDPWDEPQEVVSPWLGS